MSDYSKGLKRLLNETDCSFERQGKGDHEIWYSPVTRVRFVVDNVISFHPVLLITAQVDRL